MGQHVNIHRFMASSTGNTFFVQGVATDAILMGPIFSKLFNFAGLSFMAYGTSSDSCGLMSLVIKFHTKFEFENI